MAEAATGANAQAIYGFARNMSQIMEAAPGQTVYSYAQPATGDTPFVQAPGMSGGCDCAGIAAPCSKTDCSGWVSFVLQQKVPALYAAAKLFRDTTFPKDPCPWPRAYVYYHFFRSQAAAGLFQPITDLRQAQPGDILVWTFAPWATLPAWNDTTQPSNTHGDTGHVMVVLEGGVGLTTPAVALPSGTTLLGIAVSDSSGETHNGGADNSYADQRNSVSKAAWNQGPNARGGLGWGVIGLAVDGSGHGQGFSFNVAFKADFDPQSPNGWFAPDPGPDGLPAIMLARPLG